MASQVAPGAVRAAREGRGKSSFPGRCLDNTIAEPAQADVILSERARNRRRARLIRNLRGVYRLGDRAIIELIIQLAETLGAISRLEDLAERYVLLDPKILQSLGASGFPPFPIRTVEL